MFDTRGPGGLPTGTRIALIVILVIAAVSGMYWGFTVAGPFLAG